MIFLVLTTAAALAGSVVKAGTTVEVEGGTPGSVGEDLKRRKRARDATPEEIAKYLEELASDALEEAEAVRAADAPEDDEGEPEGDPEPPADDKEGDA